MNLPRDGLVGRALERLEEATGQSFVNSERLEILEQVYDDHRVLQRELEDIGWTVLDYLSGQPTEQKREDRMKVVQRARYVWMHDPMAGAAVELMNDFVFGRGVPNPRCKDKLVQEVVDRAWADPDNMEVLTTYEAQLALGTDLCLQSNVFMLMFDQGEDGRVKLATLRHDDVREIIPDPEKRHRMMWFVAHHASQKWDYKLGRWALVMPTDPLKVTYYPHWRNVDLAIEEQATGERKRDDPEMPPDDKIGEGKVLHIRINRYSEQKFGVPRFQRTLRWYTAYNSFVKARIDLAEASAKLIMKRKLKGSPQALARQVTQALSRTSPLGISEDPLGRPITPSPPNAAVLEENETVEHQNFRLDTGAGNAQQDAQQIRAPISAAERWTQAYFGDATQSNLATATSLELPILKMVEARQEVFESVFRWFIDRVIERAVEIGEIEPVLTPDEVAELRAKKEADTPQPPPPMMPPPEQQQQMVAQAVEDEQRLGRQILEVNEVICGQETLPLVISREGARTFFRLVGEPLVEVYEEQPQQEEEVMRDLGYDLSLPSPLRRMMSELIAGIAQLATTFDPNGTNVELSRTLLTIALGEGLEVKDPADVVEKIFPPGFDPMAALRPPVAPPGQDAGQAFPSGPDGNAYGAPMNSQLPGQNGSRGYYAQEASLVEAFKKLPDPSRKPLEGHRDEMTARFDREVADTLLDELDRITVTGE